jgi:serine/threonine-protein kinase RsbW
MSDAERQYRIEIDNDLAELARATALLDTAWTDHGLDEDTQAELNIAIEEIVSNVMRHGGVGVDRIVIHVSVSPEEIRVEVEDPGLPFNPLDHDLPDPNMPLDQRRKGGLGILMVVRMMDQVDYERRDGLNRLVITKRRGA